YGSCTPHEFRRGGSGAATVVTVMLLIFMLAYPPTTLPKGKGNSSRCFYLPCHIGAATNAPHESPCPLGKGARGIGYLITTSRPVSLDFSAARRTSMM